MCQYELEYKYTPLVLAGSITKNKKSELTGVCSFSVSYLHHPTNQTPAATPAKHHLTVNVFCFFLMAPHGTQPAWLDTELLS